MAKGSNNVSVGGKGRAKISSSSLTFRGPIRAPSAGVVTDDAIVRMSFAGYPTGTSVGMQNYYSTANVSSCTDWTNLAAVYDEYRVLGYEIDYFPSYSGGNASVVQCAGLAITTHQPNNPFPFTSIGTMAGYQDWKPFDTGKPLKLEWKMDSVEEAQFASTTGTLPVFGYTGYWAPYATSTSQYGIQLLTYVVHFRGRK